MAVIVQSNGGQYALRMRARSASLLTNLDEVFRKMGQEALREARWQSSGPFKQRMLTTMGHPYARRHQIRQAYTTKTGKARHRRVMPAARAIGEDYPARINIQTGSFLRGWKVSRGGRTSKGVPTVTLFNRTPYAKYLTARGTNRMVGRPALQSIARRLRPEVSRSVRNAVQGAYRRPGGSTALRVDIVGSFRRGYAFGAALGGL